MNKNIKIQKYNKFLDKPQSDELPENSLTTRLIGNIGEDCPSNMHRYDISFPAEVGSFTADFTSYSPKHNYTLIVKRIDKNSADITFNGNDYTLHEGMNFLFDIRESQASYDGPWFTGVDEWKAVWVK